MVIGLTGKSCAGKNEVASILEKEGFFVIDEDRLGHAALSANRDRLVSIFGPGILSGKEIDRKKLSRIVFSDKDGLKKLEAVSHPWMVSETKRIAEEKEREGKIVVINAAILTRLALDRISDEIIYVDASFETRARRAMLRNGTNLEDFRKRDQNGEDISSLFETFCGRIIKIINEGDKTTLCRQVKDYCDTILARG